MQKNVKIASSRQMAWKNDTNKSIFYKCAKGGRGRVARFQQNAVKALFFREEYDIIDMSIKIGILYALLP